MQGTSARSNVGNQADRPERGVPVQNKSVRLLTRKVVVQGEREGWVWRKGGERKRVGWGRWMILAMDSISLELFAMQWLDSPIWFG